MLNVPNVGVHDDFFLLGGSSLLVTQVVARLTTDLNVELPVRDFFANPTVATAAIHLMNLTGEQIGSDDAIAARRKRLPQIEANYFGCGDDRLFGVLYRPPRDARRHAVLICNAYGHEYARSFRNLQQLAVQLCQSGFDVLRFDYAGTGNSSGCCDENTFDRMVRDIRSAAEHLRRETNPKSLSAVGLRMGATALATSGVGLKDMILWDPVISGDSFVEMLERFHGQALRGLVRFNQVRKPGAIDQLFGHRMTPEKRNRFREAGFDDCCCIDAERRFVVCSDTAMAKGIDLDEWSLLQTNDAIRWHDADFTESAFSSPEAFHAITQTLTGRTD